MHRFPQSISEAGNESPREDEPRAPGDGQTPIPPDPMGKIIWAIVHFGGTLAAAPERLAGASPAEANAVQADLLRAALRVHAELGRALPPAEDPPYRPYSGPIPEPLRPLAAPRLERELAAVLNQVVAVANGLIAFVARYGGNGPAALPPYDELEAILRARTDLRGAFAEL